MVEPTTLAVGQCLHLKLGKDRIAYAGMPSDNVYTIVQIKSDGSKVYSWNLFYPKRQQNISIDGECIFVDNVTSEEIRLQLM